MDNNTQLIYIEPSTDDISNYKKINFELKSSLEDGIKETIEWYNLNLKNTSNWRYNSFTEFEK